MRCSSIAAAMLASVVAIPVALAAPATKPFDAPVPASIAQRVFLPEAVTGAVGDDMSQIVGFFGYLNDGKLEITTERPKSLSTTPAVNMVKVEKGKPVYDGVVSSAAGVNVGIPILNLSLANNERAQITFTDTARVIAVGSPTLADWKELPRGTGTGQWVFVTAATISVLQQTVLKEKTGALDALVNVFKIGASNYQAANGTESLLAVAVFLKPDPFKMVGASVQPTPQPATLSAAMVGKLDAVALTKHSAAEAVK